MKLIKLGSGGKTMVDDEDYENLKDSKWYVAHNGYVVKGIYNKMTQKTRSQFMHRVIMNTPNGMFTDHINHNKLDNRKCNLRICTRSGNQMNRKVSKNNKSGHKGVSWNKWARKWRAQISKNGKTYLGGYYDDVKEASKVYQQKAKELFGEFNYYEWKE